MEEKNYSFSTVITIVLLILFLFLVMVHADNVLLGYDDIDLTGNYAVDKDKINTAKDFNLFVLIFSGLGIGGILNLIYKFSNNIEKKIIKLFKKYIKGDKK